MRTPEDTKVGGIATRRGASPTGTAAAERWDLIVVGAGPGGCAAAIEAARAGMKVVVFERHRRGRDKVCGDGLTPRATTALDHLGVDWSAAHRIDGLRMIAGRVRREMPWPDGGPFGRFGAVWPRRSLDAVLADHAEEAGAVIRWETPVEVLFEDRRVVGVVDGSHRATAPLVVVAAGAPGSINRALGAERDPDEPFGLAMRTYATTPRHADRLLEACLTLTDEAGTPVPGYGWLFPAGDGTVNIGVGALSTMRGFKRLNLANLLRAYRRTATDEWGLGPDLEPPRAWRLPFRTLRRHGPGWVAVGDAAGLINPMNGEGIDYALESGILAGTLASSPSTAPQRYDEAVGRSYDAFLRTGRRFSALIGHPWILRAGLRASVSTAAIADLTLAVMANLVEPDGTDARARTLRGAGRVLTAIEPWLVRSSHERR
ncbi:MAG: geranylgeranyl reductase family protein [Microthrixaceae bacterium]